MKKEISAMATIVFVLSLMSLCCFPVAPLAALLGLIAWVRFRGKAGQRLSGGWMATSGFVASTITSLLLAAGGLYLWSEWPHLVCNRNLVAIGKAIHEYEGDFYDDGEESAELLQRLVRNGLVTSEQTRCPASTSGEAYVLLSRRDMERTGIIAHDPGRHHGGERGVLHREETIHTSPTRFSSTGDGGMSYEYEYVVLWVGDPMPEDRFQAILGQEYPEDDERGGEDR